MDDLLKLLQENATAPREDLAGQLGISSDEVIERIKQYEKDGVILGYQAILDSEKINDNNSITAVIEVRITPERGEGFDHLAGRIARFEQVQSCYLVSGGFDLMVIVHGQSLKEVATFVAKKLSPLSGVVSTCTHFQLKCYKANGFLTEQLVDEERLAVAP